MVKIKESNNVSKFNRAKLRKFRETAGLTIEDCVLESGLEEDWRRVERGDIDSISRDMAYEIAYFLDCDIEDLLTDHDPDSDPPITLPLCDSENWTYSPDAKSGLRVKVDPDKRCGFLTVNCEDATPEEMNNIWAMLSQCVTE